MPLVKAQCTNCGANLEISSEKDAAICPYCNTAYIVEKAIQQFNSCQSESVDSLLQRGIKSLELNSFEDSEKTFKQMTSMYPENYKGWLGLAILSGIDPYRHIDKRTCEANAHSLCPPELKGILAEIVIINERINENVLKEIQLKRRSIESGERALEEKKLELNHSQNRASKAVMNAMGEYIDTMSGQLEEDKRSLNELQKYFDHLKSGKPAQFYIDILKN